MNNPTWILMHPKATPEMLGRLPSFLDIDDPRLAKEQLDSNYQHGGGWRNFEGFKVIGDMKIQYPGDPAIPPIAITYLRDERIVMYPHAWVAIFQPDGNFEICRMD